MCDPILSRYLPQLLHTQWLYTKCCSKDGLSSFSRQILYRVSHKNLNTVLQLNVLNIVISLLGPVLIQLHPVVTAQKITPKSLVCTFADEAQFYTTWLMSAKFNMSTRQIMLHNFPGMRYDSCIPQFLFLRQHVIFLQLVLTAPPSKNAVSACQISCKLLSFTLIDS